MAKRAKDPDIITAEQVAEAIGIGRNSVYEAAARNEIPARRVGRRYIFSRRAILAWRDHRQGEIVA